MEHIDILYDHYKESISLMKAAQRDRDRFFIIVCILLSLLFIFGLDPQSTVSTLQQLAHEQWGITTMPETSILRTLLWGVLLYSTLQYIQKNIYSERLTTYIHELEAEFERQELPITRESKDYLNEYPKVLNLIYYIYTIIFPFLYLTLIGIESKYEFRTSPSFLNLILAATNFLLVFLYILFLHRDKLSPIREYIRRR